MLGYRSAPFTFSKAGVFYFIRKVPKDLRHHYTSPKISHSLRMASARIAATRSLRAAQRLDEHWYHLRLQDSDLRGKHMLRLGVSHRPATVDYRERRSADADESLLLSEAVAVYLRLKGSGRPVTFHRNAERSCGYVSDVCGDKPITACT